MTVGYFTGWRVKSELLTLQRSHVDWKAGTITLDAGTTKNNEGRTYPFGQFPELTAVLQAQRKAADQIAKTRDLIVPWVFFRVTKTKVERIKSYKTAWALATLAAGLPNRLVHDLRRSGVRSLRQASVPENVAMQLTGHKTRSVFDRYDIVDPRDRAVAVGKLAAFHAQNSGLRDNHGTVSLLPLTPRAQQHG
jgi:integrase